ncbi:glycosyltransferase family 4 protein [Aliarcobacter butzleri]|uniref:glycosyltransferase family 4 protein n=1 Tax=Aliarcobacter butzleri TaxID=28197 RepID=UPI003AF82F21
MKKLVIIVTVPVVLETWLKGQAKFLANYYEVEIITSYSQKIKDIEKFENANIKIMDFNRQINLIKDLKVLLQLFLYLLKTRPFIVYTLTPKAGLLGMIAAWMARIPHRIHNVVGLPHLEAIGKKKVILEITERITYFFTNKLYCNSLNLKSIVTKMSGKDVNVIANGSVNGVDTEFFQDNLSQDKKSNISKKFALNSGDFIITFIGRIVKDKGINELVNVFNDLNLKYPFTKLFLIGDYKNESDPISKNSQDIIQKNKCIMYFEFQEDIREYLAISNLFVLPSYREGLPNVLIEAGSYGIPLVATNINGCNEIIIDGNNGILVTPKDEISLYTAIEKLILNKEYYYSIKNNVRLSILNRYSQKYFYSQLLKEFSILKDKI